MPKLAHYFIMLVSDLSGEPVRAEARWQHARLAWGEWTVE